MAWASQWPAAVKHRLHQRRWKQRHELPVWSPYRIRKEREKLIYRATHGLQGDPATSLVTAKSHETKWPGQNMRKK